MRVGARLVLATALAGAAFACRQPPRAPTLASALAAARPPGRDLRVIGTPPWAHLIGVWGSPPITHGAIEVAAFAGDGRLVTLNGNDGTVRVWDVRSRLPIAAFDRCPPPAPSDGPARDVIDYNRYTLALSADGRMAAVGHGNGDVCVRRLDDGKLESAFHTGSSGLRHLSFWGGTRLVSYARHSPRGIPSVLPACAPDCPAPPPDGFIRVWDVVTGSRIAERHVGALPGDDQGRPALAVSPDGSRLFFPNSKMTNEISALDLATMQPIWTWRLDGEIGRVGLSSSDRLVVAARRPGQPGGLRVSELALADGRVLASADVPHFELVALDARGPRAVVREPNARERPFHDVQLWDVPAMKLRRTASKHARANGCSDAPMPQGKGTFSPDGSVLATWTDGVTLWDADRLAPLSDGPGHCGGVSALALSPDASRALSVAADETVREWRVSDGTELRRWPRRATRATYSPDGTKILIAGDTVVPVLDAGGGRVLWEVDGRRWQSHAGFSPDGTLVATVGVREDLTIHDARTGRALWSHGARSAGTSLIVFTPDSRYVVANAETHELAVWEAHTGRLVRRLGRGAQTVAMRRDGVLVFQEHHSAVWLPVDGRPAAVRDNVHLGFPAFLLTPDENRALVTARGRVTLRQLDDGADLGHIDLTPFDDSATALALSPDGTRLLIGTRRGVIVNVRTSGLGPPASAP
jgi:WD40 repeat protein